MKKKIIKVFPKIKLMKGLEIRTASVGIKSTTREDVTLIIFRELANVATVLTKSKTCAANITWLKKIRNSGKAKVLFVNSGNANAYTGKKGYQNVIHIVKTLSKIYECDVKNILISSTGVIGEQLPIEKIIQALHTLALKNNKLNQNWLSFAKAITTTDTFPKGVCKKTSIKNKSYNIIGVSKGSGMIAPNMATMLAFIFTDANLSSKALNRLLKSTVQKSFNSITVDGDTSTNDMVSLFSVNSKKNNSKYFLDNEILDTFKKDLEEVAIELAKKIVLDGEGAKKLIEVEVSGAKTNNQAKDVALKISNSLLVKTAIAGEDANWGRIIMAIGKSSSSVNPNKISLNIGKSAVIVNGEICKDYSEEKVSEYLKNTQINIAIDLSLGKGHHKVWTCDLTKKYIEINADYRS